ncbi:SRR1-like protein isoform X2 [Bufo gargarizans]|uniref:SRR1-like protein isoform X2 n=1 Tax=Bufo gargarizans TaxID=30331 RepID=UPI001CF4F7E1|nr:SRR1-like protein isoform X2 [Bufo gargarizans]
MWPLHPVAVLSDLQLERSRMESGTWQVVSKKKAMKKSSRLKENPAGSERLHNLDPDMGCSNVIKRINETMADLRASDFWDSCQDISPATSDASSINEELMKNLHLEGSRSTCISLQSYDCVCYGLGNFTSCVISRHQMAFLLLFLEQFKIPRRQCYVFDPVFSPSEIAVLQDLGLTVLLTNEEGKHAVRKPTVFYMPHCGKALYNNLLWRNWSGDALSQMVIIGNSFKGIEERLVSRILQRDYIYIYKSLQVVEETSLPESIHYSDVFNDTSIHSFPTAKLKSFPKETWQSQDEPQYQDCEDLEIIVSPTR